MRAPRRVLVLDDDPAFGGYVAEVARRMGCEVHALSTPAELALLRPRADDVLVLDLVLDDTDGVELLRDLGGLDRAPRVVLASGVDARVVDAARRLAVAWGVEVVDTLAKPCGVAEVRRAIGRALGDRVPDSPRRPPALFDPERLLAWVGGGGVVAALQPQVDLATGAVVGHEALVRLRTPDGCLLGPDVFLPVVMAAGLEGALAGEVLRQALAAGGAARHGTLSVNVSPVLLQDAGLPDRFHALVAEAGVDPARVVVEVTESAFAADATTRLDVATRLRLRGFGLSIDDFGTGWSTLSLLHETPFTELKIDRSFVAAAPHDVDARRIVWSAIELAQRLDLRCVAEGIETEAEEAVLRELGCGHAQGYRYGRPAVPPTAEVAVPPTAQVAVPLDAEVAVRLDAEVAVPLDAEVAVSPTAEVAARAS